MDAYQQHHRYVRPSQQPSVPPSTTDPHYYHHQPGPPVPPQGTWYGNQFQYHPPSSSHSPSPPPPQQWPASSHPDHLAPPPPPPPHPSAYPPPPPPSHHPYSAHVPPQNHHFLPPAPRPHVPPPPLPYSQISQSYPQVNQEWGNPNWGQHQSWDYPVHNNVEDWAARARAWAAAKQMEDQHAQSQFTPVGRPEEPTQFHDWHPQAVDSHYRDIQQHPFTASGFSQFPVSAAPLHQPLLSHPQETAAFNAGQSSYISDGSLSYPVGGGTSAGAPSTSPSVHQQEVPSSYSSVAGKEEAADQKEQLYNTPLLLRSSAPGHHLSLPAISGSALSEQPFAYGNEAADPLMDISDRPLDFASSFSRDHDPQMPSTYAAHHDSAGTVRGIASATTVPSVNSWTPATGTGAVYAPIPPVLPSGPQCDPSIALPSVAGHAAPPFGTVPGPSFQPTIPSAGSPYGLGTGTALHPSTSFPGDAYGLSNVSERPKKASVPNWLKEEIIKNASVITRSSLEHPKEAQTIEDEGVDKSFGKDDQADSKSIDSSKSTEEEDNDEDYAEAARTAAINQEIKRVLTEVLLKVTDELFDEIATKVLDEDDLPVEVEHNTVESYHKESPSPQAVLPPKASAKVIVPIKAKESQTEDVSEKSSSSAPGNVLGLANYASDEEEEEEEEEEEDNDDGEIQSSGMSNFRKHGMLQQLNIPKFSENTHDATINGSSQMDIGKNSKGHAHSESDLNKLSSLESKNKINAAMSGLSEHAYSSKVVSGVGDVDIIVDSGTTLDGNGVSWPETTPGEHTIMKSELLDENVGVKKSMADDPQARETKVKPNQDSRRESRSFSGKDFKDTDYGSRVDEKGDSNRMREDEKHMRKEKADDQNGSRERIKEGGAKTQEKAKASESRKRSSHVDAKEDRKEEEKFNRGSAKEESVKKKEWSKDKEEDKTRHRPTSDSSRHKRRRSSSISSRGRNCKDNDSSDGSSDDSKRKQHSRKQHLSPSPVRSRRRQVSRSPHSKHSQRRHSPYSSFEKTRGRRSRSKSPIRRRR